MTNDYTNGTRIEGTKEDLQRIVDMLNIAIYQMPVDIEK